ATCRLNAAGWALPRTRAGPSLAHTRASILARAIRLLSCFGSATYSSIFPSAPLLRIEPHLSQRTSKSDGAPQQVPIPDAVRSLRWLPGSRASTVSRVPTTGGPAPETSALVHTPAHRVGSPGRMPQTVESTPAFAPDSTARTATYRDPGN